MNHRKCTVSWISVQRYLPAAIIVLARTVGSILLSSTVNSSCKLFSQNLSEININFARDNVAAARNYTIKTMVMKGMKRRYIIYNIFDSSKRHMKSILPTLESGYLIGELHMSIRSGAKRPNKLSPERSSFSQIFFMNSCSSSSAWAPTTSMSSSSSLACKLR